MERRSERRLVSCVFIDLVGSTGMGQRLGPERMQRVLSDSFREISAIATEAGGTIEKYIGDEVFILFGAPAAHSDDVIRALRVAESSVRWAATSPNPISIRVGIETGEALVDLDAVGERDPGSGRPITPGRARVRARQAPVGLRARRRWPRVSGAPYRSSGDRQDEDRRGLRPGRCRPRDSSRSALPARDRSWVIAASPAPCER